MGIFNRFFGENPPMSGEELKVKEQGPGVAPPPPEADRDTLKAKESPVKEGKSGLEHEVKIEDSK